MLFDTLDMQKLFIIHYSWHYDIKQRLLLL